MLEKIKEVYSRFTFLSPKDLFLLASMAKLKMVDKNEHIIKEGDLNYDVMVVIKGLLRHYIVDKHGIEKTMLFVPEKRTTACADTLFNNRPSAENIIALENSIIVKFDYKELEKISADNIRLLKAQNLGLMEIIASDVDHIRALTIFTPEERYLHFCRTYPELEQRLKQKYLASYLGVTATSLSRIKARLSKG